MKTLDEMIAELPAEHQDDVWLRAKELIDDERIRRSLSTPPQQRWQIAWTNYGPRLEPSDCPEPWDCPCSKDGVMMCGTDIRAAKNEIGEYWKSLGQTILEMSDEEFLKQQGLTESGSYDDDDE